MKRYVIVNPDLEESSRHSHVEPFHGFKPDIYLTC